jgi:indole-3-glycerol phosphate synthase
MEPILSRILDEKRREVAALKAKRASTTLRSDVPTRDFDAALNHGDRIRLIAEIKFASPSAGTIRNHSDPVVIGRAYNDAGAAAISLLTDRPFFGGSLDALPRLKTETGLPVLRKDFLIDPVQVEESHAHGADAILLICRIMSKPQLGEMIDAATALGLSALVEIHDEPDLQKALDAGARIIGINNRDLSTLKVDLRTTASLAPLIPAGVTVVSESGIGGPEDIVFVGQFGVRAVLVGSSLMRSRDIFEKTKVMVEAGRKAGGRWKAISKGGKGRPQVEKRTAEYRIQNVESRSEGLWEKTS